MGPSEAQAHSCTLASNPQCPSMALRVKVTLPPGQGVATTPSPQWLSSGLLHRSPHGAHFSSDFLVSQPWASAPAAPPAWVTFPTPSSFVCLRCSSGLSSIPCPLRNRPQHSPRVGQVPPQGSLSPTVSPHWSPCMVASASLSTWSLPGAGARGPVLYPVSAEPGHKVALYTRL